MSEPWEQEGSEVEVGGGGKRRWKILLGSFANTEPRV